MTPSQTFLSTHWDHDPLQLLLQQERFPEVDMRWVAQQIEGRRQAREKWPSFFSNTAFEYPPQLNREQSSSEATARYKASLIPQGCHLTDMTGGMGVDSYFFSQRAAQVDYFEHDPALAALVERNLQLMGVANVAVHAADSAEAPLSEVVFLDPARRNAHGHKVQAFEDCEPNLLELLPRLRATARRLLIKASPMTDIALACSQLGGADEVHVVAVRGECKEVLFLQQSSHGEPQVHAVDLWPSHTHHHSFTPSQEACAEAPLASAAGPFLLEPHAALLKAGCHKLLCQWYPVEKLARNSHLYASSTPIEQWPGRQFEVLRELPLNPKDAAKAIPSRKAHILSRNHPLGAEELRRRLRLQEGGELHVVATTLREKPLGLLCRRVHP